MIKKSLIYFICLSLVLLTGCLKVDNVNFDSNYENGDDLFISFLMMI